ncbi:MULTISPECIES: ribose-phosphate diphosphokinase [Alicyclobacillus]|uniref:Ribose-phosphate pyrophosphokinase n=3 Tax=Alicyclobacillus TaxID=29330 RepID=C8WQR4_ALIAD|nr:MULTISPECIES: ribose-phosphate pyrophosphokinase [Alicyclobacillus]ACV57242.1 ribose-phosphate pyrophosphokinase [Alicyclobacillus acidocaldarius subsp. acidocaldarius DSM 446]AEJ42220.1 ribose-phosphate pyrophosphokinase [Alicyclobacillus acidocaldarius subsp. acidocaldarius Tc-4-1]MDI9260802.1 ribose-phosphate pyrophosphokinase [Alicyclobacillus sendaiensis PA2]
MAIDADLKLVTGNANPALAQEIADYIGVPLADCQVGRFSDGEVRIRLGESVRGANVFIIQPTSQPVNEHLMELLILMDAVKRASARTINVVIPYYGYARQDRKARARDPITAKLVANLLQTAGASRVISMDLHAGQIQGFFDIPVDHLIGMPILADYFLDKQIENPVVVSPDMGGVTRARAFAERLGAPLAIIDKRRPDANVAQVMNIIGDIEGKTAILIDDMIDTAGTITAGAAELLKRGARGVYACCIHPVLSGQGVERLQNSAIEEVVVTNTIALPEHKRIDKIKVLSVAELIAEAIIRVHTQRSVSQLFD